jgi:hypothetical protein
MEAGQANTTGAMRNWSQMHFTNRGGCHEDYLAAACTGAAGCQGVLRQGELRQKLCGKNHAATFPARREQTSGRDAPIATLLARTMEKRSRDHWLPTIANAANR